MRFLSIGPPVSSSLPSPGPVTLPELASSGRFFMFPWPVLLHEDLHLIYNAPMLGAPKAIETGAKRMRGSSPSRSATTG